jgi:ABC-type lipoprotein release transport system permease subunit
MKKKDSYVGLLLILGAAIGTLVFIFTQEPWHIGAGAGLGIIIGAIANGISYNRKK